MSGYATYTSFAGVDCHCSGTGLVMMDDRGIGSNVAEPCPMCTTGGRRSSEFVGWVDQFPPAIDRKDQTRIVEETTSGRYRPRDSWHNRDGVHIDVTDWYHGVNIQSLSWNGGLTLRHRYRCHRGTRCVTSAFVTHPGDVCQHCAPAQPGVTRPRYADLMQIARQTRRGQRSVLTGADYEAARVELEESRRAREAAAEDHGGEAA